MKSKKLLSIMTVCVLIFGTLLFAGCSVDNVDTEKANSLMDNINTLTTNLNDELNKEEPVVLDKDEVYAKYNQLVYLQNNNLNGYGTNYKMTTSIDGYSDNSFYTLAATAKGETKVVTKEDKTLAMENTSYSYANGQYAEMGKTFLTKIDSTYYVLQSYEGSNKTYRVANDGADTDYTSGGWGTYWRNFSDQCTIFADKFESLDGSSNKTEIINVTYSDGVYTLSYTKMIYIVCVDNGVNQTKSTSSFVTVTFDNDKILSKVEKSLNNYSSGGIGFAYESIVFNTTYTYDITSIENLPTSLDGYTLSE